MQQNVIKQASTLPMAQLMAQKFVHKNNKKMLAFINSVMAYKLKGCNRNDNPISM